MTIQLRPYQQQADNEIQAAWAGGARVVAYICPTGGGKSINLSHDTLRDYQRGEQQITVAHRQELIGQMSLHTARVGVPHQIIGPKPLIASITAEHRREFGRSFIVPGANCSVGSVDTLMARAADIEGSAWALNMKKWRCDEGHHLLRENKWGKSLGWFKNALGLSVTATPQRADGQGLGRHADGLVDHMVLAPTMRELIDMGMLTDYEFVIPTTDYHSENLNITPGGDFSPKQMKQESERSRIYGDVVVNYCRFALGKQAIVFSTDVDTANKTAAQFNLFGIPAASVSANTPDDVRSEYIRRFRAGTLRVLVNVDLFGEGFDLPAIEVVIMARPTNSLAVYLQQIGRALRLMPGKTYGLIIDMVSNFKRHGFPDKRRVWSLDRREKRAKQLPDPDELELTHCLKCYKPFEPVYRVCPHCGEPVPVAAPGVGGRGAIEQVDGDLMMLDAAMLKAMREAVELPSAAQAGAQQAFAAGMGNGQAHFAAIHQQKLDAQRALSDAIDLWAGQRLAAGEALESVYRRFYKTMGCTTLDVLAATRTRADYDKTREIIESWLK